MSSSSPAKSQAFCVSSQQLEPAVIAELHKAHPGALPVSIDWTTDGNLVSAVVWWVPRHGDPLPTEPESDMEFERRTRG